MTLHAVRRGAGRPLLLVHGLGGSARSWDVVLPALAARREVVLVDLPGHGQTPMLPGEVTVAALADALVEFLDGQGLREVDTVGSSLGGRLVLELARRGVGGSTVALDPGGFWGEAALTWFALSLKASIGLVRAIRPALPLLTASPVGRTALLTQFSARPWALPPDVARHELQSIADSPGVDATLAALVIGPRQEGAPAGTLPGRVTIGWGRQDRVTFAGQARRATELFPDAALHWFDDCGHFPMWDQPEQTVRLILDATA